MKFTDFSEFKDKVDKFINLAKKGEDIIVTKSGKPILSIAGITKDDIEDFVIAKHYNLDKKSKNITQNSFISHKKVKKHLGF